MTNEFLFNWHSIEPGRWSPEKRSNYNLLDAVSRHTIQVFPKSWAAILLTFDNAGMWNLRSELTENRYLGQQLYISVLSPARSLRDEYNIPDNTLLCGLVKDMPLPKPYTIWSIYPFWSHQMRNYDTQQVILESSWTFLYMIGCK